MSLFVVLLAVFILALLLVGITYGAHWLRINREKQRRRRILAEDANPSTEGQVSGPVRRRRRRRSTRANPTLAETGGLPPKRPTSPI